MADINLLPWRAKSRIQILMRLGGYVCLSLIIALCVIYFIHVYAISCQRYQMEHNQHLEQKIARLKRVKTELVALKRRHHHLADKMKKIEHLLQMREFPIFVLHELALITPEKLFITHAERHLNRIKLSGMATSSQVITLLMSNILANESILKTDLPEIKRLTQQHLREFKLNLVFKDKHSLGRV